MLPGLSVAVYAKYKGKILLVHHRRLRLWLPVGGSVETGETPFEAAQREFAEETGLEPRWPSPSLRGAPMGLIAYTEHLDPDKGLRMTFSFVARVCTQEIRLHEEFSEYQWVKSVEGLNCPPNVEDICQLIWLRT